MCQDRVMRKRLERFINVVCAVKVPTMSSLLGISEPEPGVPGQRDAGGTGAGEQTGGRAPAECCSCRLQLRAVRRCATGNTRESNKWRGRRCLKRQ
jgi:hypothetical protein